MEILKTTLKDETAEDKIKLYKTITTPENVSITKLIDSEITITGYVMFSDFNEKDNKEITVLALLVEEYPYPVTTISETAIKDFFNATSGLWDVSENNPLSFKVLRGISKAGREFVQLAIV